MKNIVNDGAANRTIFDVLKKAHNDGYSNVRVVGGADRQKEFDKLVKLTMVNYISLIK